MNKNGMDTKEWQALIDSLEELIPRYNFVNRLITFGFDEYWRSIAAKYADKNDIILEIGSGPGTFANHVFVKEYICLDPSEEMLELSKKKLKNRENIKFVHGTAENIPFEKNHFTKVFSVFSFRDFQNKSKAISEITRILKTNGQFIILDIGKPTNPVANFLLTFYISSIVPCFTSIFFDDKRKNPYTLFVDTYQALAPWDYYISLMGSKGLVLIEKRVLPPLGAYLVILEKRA